MRYAKVTVVLLAIVGCHNNQPSFNPFSSGPTVLPPPGTGSAGRPDPYYRPAPAGAVPNATAPALPGAAPGYTPSSPAPGYGASWSAQPAGTIQTARFTSDDATQLQVADQRAGFTTATAPSTAPSTSAAVAATQPAPGYAPPAQNIGFAQPQAAAVNPAPPQMPAVPATRPASGAGWTGQ